MKNNTELNLLICQTEFEIAREKFFKSLDRYTISRHKLAVAMEEAGVSELPEGDQTIILNRETGDIGFSPNTGGDHEQKS